MIGIKKKSNIFLIFVFLSVTVFYSYFINQNKGSIKVDTKEATQNSIVNNIEKGVTTFKDVEYRTLDAKNRDYITKGNEAKITKDNPDLIELKTVHSFTNLKDGTVLNINSEKADYFKKTKKIKYYQNVVITNNLEIFMNKKEDKVYGRREQTKE